VAIDRRHVAQHLELAATAYGADLMPPNGVCAPRAAGAAPVAVPAPPPVPIDAATPPTATSQTATSQTPTSPTPTSQTLAAATATTAPRAPASPATAGEVADAAAELEAQKREVMPCTRCKLHEGRQHAVFGEGNARARVMFVGEAPGATEDQTGRPFVGAAGQLLDRIITGAMGLQRSDVYIANINKCRPPGNREPAPDEVAACLPFLRRQIASIRPEVIVCLGRVAAQNLLGTHESTTRMRGRTLEYLGVPVIVTWHPAYLLRDPSHKRETWDDIKRVNRLLGLPEVPAPPAG
jgi:DNA polymerase